MENKVTCFKIFNRKNGQECDELIYYFYDYLADPNFKILSSNISTYLDEDGEFSDRILVTYTKSKKEA